MKVKDIIKKQTTLIAMAVILVVVATIGISYAIFFQIKTNSKDQEIVSGTLKLTVSDISALPLSTPLIESAGLESTPVNYTIKNTDSNLPAKYDVYIYADSANTMDLSKLKFSTDGTNATVLNSITPETIDGKTCYKIENGNIDAGAEVGKNVRIWVDEDLLTSAVDAQVSLKMYIVSEVQE